MPATLPDGSLSRNWLTVVHFNVTTSDLARLERLERKIRQRSRWPVRDISRSGQYVPVQVRPGVTVLRLAETVGTAGPNVQIRLQISGPDVIFSLPDVLPICLIVLIVVGFGASERASADVFAFPPGMHPAIVFSQILALTLFACFLFAYAHESSLTKNLGMLVLDAAVCVNTMRWLWLSKLYWNGARTLRITRRAIMAVGVALTVAGVFVATNG